MLLLKIWRHCLEFPGSVALILRQEYTDLRDSTLKDVKRYFGIVPDRNKEYKFANGSVVMFRHGAELNVLKNMTLSIIGIEQSEEFETDEQFTYLRDRLRHPVGTLQLCQICNANGHNWIWRSWLNNPPSEQYHLLTILTISQKTSQMI
jgi:phage terminase large subunit